MMLRRALLIGALSLAVLVPIAGTLDGAISLHETAHAAAAQPNDADEPKNDPVNLYVRNPMKPGAQFCLLGFFCDLNPMNVAGVSYGYRLFRFVLSFLGLLFILILIYGGYRMVVSQGDEKAYEEGKKALAAGIIGFIILILSYAAVNTFVRFAS